MEEVRIRSEEEAWNALAYYMPKKDFGDIDFLFDGWPKLELTIKGKDFNGTIPTRIMPPMLELQREIHKTYCILRYGNDNLRRLTSEDRERLEIVVKIGEGSSIFTAEFWKELNETIRLSMVDMESKHKMIMVIALALSVAAPVSWKFWLSNQEKLKELETSVRLEQIENERIKMLSDARESYADVAKVSKGVDEFRNHTLHQLRSDDQFSIYTDKKEELSITGEHASQITHKPREKSIEIRLDGDFLIEEVKSGGIRGFKIKVKRISDAKILSVTIPDGALEKSQIDTLKNNEWAKKPVVMQINAKELRGRITSAVLVSADEIPKK
ncbi:MAG: hypothetical protein AB2792_01850 [Candidatus Thiodiazotropha sp.]